jgi:hypothetical protein
MSDENRPNLCKILKICDIRGLILQATGLIAPAFALRCVCADLARAFAAAPDISAWDPDDLLEVACKTDEQRQILVFRQIRALSPELLRFTLETLRRGQFSKFTAGLTDQLTNYKRTAKVYKSWDSTARYYVIAGSSVIEVRQTCSTDGAAPYICISVCLSHASAPTLRDSNSLFSCGHHTSGEWLRRSIGKAGRSGPICGDDGSVLLATAYDNHYERLTPDILDIPAAVPADVREALQQIDRAEANAAAPTLGLLPAILCACKHREYNTPVQLTKNKYYLEKDEAADFADVCSPRAIWARMDDVTARELKYAHSYADLSAGTYIYLRYGGFHPFNPLEGCAPRPPN